MNLGQTMIQTGIPKESIQFLITNDDTVDKAPVHSKVGLEKRESLKMDVSKITRYTEDCFSDSNCVPNKSKMLEVDFMEQNGRCASNRLMDICIITSNLNQLMKTWNLWILFNI